MTELFPHSLKSRIILSVLALAAAIGLIQGIREITTLSDLRQKNPFVFAGRSLEGVKDLLQNEKYVGFISDRNMKDQNISAQFAQYQLALAPVILDLNNPRHRFLILDCANPQNAAAVMIQTKARPIRKNSLGTILAERTAP